MKKTTPDSELFPDKELFQWIVKRTPSNSQLRTWIIAARNQGIKDSELDCSPRKPRTIHAFLDDYRKNPGKPYPANDDNERQIRIAYMIQVMLDRNIITKEDIEKTQVSNESKATNTTPKESAQMRKTQKNRPTPKPERTVKPVKETTPVETVATVETQTPVESAPIDPQTLVKFVPTESVQADILPLKQRLETLENKLVVENTRLRDDLDDLKNQLSQSQNQTTLLQSDNDRMQKELASIQDENNRLQRELASLQSVKVPSMELDQLRKENNDLIQQCQNLRECSQREQLLFASLIAENQHKHARELEAIRQDYEAKQSPKQTLFGLSIKSTVQKQTRLNGHVTSHRVFYAYYQGKKISLGGKYDKQHFEEKIKQWFIDNHVPIPAIDTKPNRQQAEILLFPAGEDTEKPAPTNNETQSP